MTALTKMKNEKRNLDNINQLAPHTKLAALDWYNLVKKEGIEILIYETKRSLDKQKENVSSGASMTLKSYHLTGQGIDWVLVDKDNKALWNGYTSADGKKVIDLAKQQGFLSGIDWKTFKDSPHLEFHYKGYGKDFIAFTGTVHEGDEGDLVGDIQNYLNIKVDKKFGPATTKAVKEFQKANGLVVDGIFGIKSFNKMFN